MRKPRCRACKVACSELAKRYDPVLGYVCPECHGFLFYADKVLKRTGIEGVMYNKPENEKP